MADAHGSGPCGGNTLRVQVPSPAGEAQSRKVVVSVLRYFVQQKYNMYLGKRRLKTIGIPLLGRLLLGLVV